MVSVLYLQTKMLTYTASKSRKYNSALDKLMLLKNREYFSPFKKHLMSDKKKINFFTKKDQEREMKAKHKAATVREGTAKQ